MNTKIGALVKTSLVDFPGMVSAVIFFKHCNLRCPYCYNVSLVNGIDEDDFVSLEELKNHLQKRKNVISGLVISGGEALLSPYTKEVILFARELGYGDEEDLWGIVGLLHDLDFEKYPELASKSWGKVLSYFVKLLIISGINFSILD